MIRMKMVTVIILLLSLTFSGCIPRNEPVVNAAEYGNTNGNIAGGGYAVIKDGWLYYTNTSDNDHLYKKEVNGTLNVQIGGSHLAYNINVVGGWVYYLAGLPGKVYKVDVDGKGLQLLDYRNCSNLIVVGGNIFYTASNGNSVNLYRIDAATGDQRELTKDVNAFSIDNNVIYFSHVVEYFNRETMSNGTCDFYKIDINGENLTKLSDDDPMSINIVGEYLYYSNRSDNDKLYRMKNDGSDKAIISQNACWGVKIYGDHIFYRNQEQKSAISKMNLDGSNNIVLLEGNLGIISIVNDELLFCKITERNNGTYFIADLDGGNVREWP